MALSLLWGVITLVPLIAASTAVDGNALPFILGSILLVSIPVVLGARGCGSFVDGRACRRSR